MGKDAVTEFARHAIKGGWTIVEGGNEGKDSSTCICSSIHIADVNLVEWCLADAQHKGALLFETNVGSPLDERGCNPIRNTGQRAHAARDHNHRIGGIRPAGDIGTDVRVRLLVNLKGGFFNDGRKNLGDEVAAAGESELLGHDSQGAVGGDEVNVLHSTVALDGEQKVPEEQRPTRASRSNGQVLR